MLSDAFSVRSYVLAQRFLGLLITAVSPCIDIIRSWMVRTRSLYSGSSHAFDVIQHILAKCLLKVLLPWAALAFLQASALQTYIDSRRGGGGGGGRGGGGKEGAGVGVQVHASVCRV